MADRPGLLALPTMGSMATPLVSDPVVPLPPARSSPARSTPTGIDAGTAWHYGDPIGEQRAADRAAVLFDRSNRDVLTVTGPDRLTWLHTLTSQFRQHLADGAGHRGAGAVPAGPRRAPLRASPNSARSPTWTPNPARGAALLGYLEACGSGRRWRSPTSPPSSPA